MNALTPSPVHFTAKQIARIGFMKPPKDTNMEALTAGYFDALKSFPAAAIEDAIDGFLNGRFGERKWLPLPPELATMVRSCLAGTGQKVEGRPYRYSMPKSRILKQGCTKEWVRDQRAIGLLEPGVIWVPGPYAENAQWGDLFAPDPEWKPAVRIPTREEAKAAERQEAA